MATTYVTGSVESGDFRTARAFAREHSEQAHSAENVYLRNARLSRDVLVAAYRGGRPVTVGDVPRDTVIRTLRQSVGNIVI